MKLNKLDGFFSLRTPIIFSLIIHLSIVLLVSRIPLEKKDRVMPFIASLLTADEFERVQTKKSNNLKETPFKRPRSLQTEKDILKQKRHSQVIQPIIPKDIISQMSRKETPKIPPDAVSSKNSDKSASPGNTNNGTTNHSGQENQEANTLKAAGTIRQQTTKETGNLHNTLSSPSLREKIFDREVVEKIAKKEEVKKDTSITFDTGEFKHYTYLRRLKEKIEGIWKYPPDAAMKGIYGDLRLRFTIKKDGTLGNMELIRTSGHRSLDEAAKQALRDAEPFWPLPEEWGGDTLTIDGHFVYSMYGTYIR